MECPHLDESVQITAPSAFLPPPTEWCCSACRTEQSPWICLSCGKIHCGRYVNGHAKAHFEERTKHCVCLDTDSQAAFCYTCDEFVLNDTSKEHLKKLRAQIEQLLHHSKNNVKENNENAENHDHRRKLRRRLSTESVTNSKKKRKTEDSKKVKPKTSGLRNLGNTCFMNAVLQSLSNIQSFCGYIKQLPSLEQKMGKRRMPHTRSCSRDGNDVFVIEELRKILVALWQGSKSAISPDTLFSAIWKVVPRFRGYQQQDAHEFMRYLLDRLHTELLTLLPYPNNNSQFIGPKGKSSIVTAIFGGLLQNEVTCLVCGMESKKHDPFLDLSLDIPAQAKAKSSEEGAEAQRIHISDCLSHFTEEEELEETELYMCSNCKQKQRSTKKFWIRRLPNVLCLHLKRFRWNVYYRVKLDNHVEFPIRGLDMSRFVLDNLYETRTSCSTGESNEYDLAAVIVHHGSGAGSGHYTAYATHEGRWYHFNDSSVSGCDEETVAKCKAYMLFYVRRELKIPDYLTVKI